MNVNEEWVVYHRGKPRLVINGRLLSSKGSTKKLPKIKELHQERLELEEEMLSTDDRGLLSLFDALYTQIEFELQEAWGFDKSANFHRFWKRPKCTCAKWDNEDRYPYGLYIRDTDCPLHGDLNES